MCRAFARSDSARHLPLSRRGDQGFSILEILVALLIGVVVLMALTDILASSKLSYLREEDAARMQESGRFAMLAMSTDVRPARSLDCYRLGVPNQLPILAVNACDLRTASNCNAGTPDVLSGHRLTLDTPLGYDAADQKETAWLAGLPTAAKDNIASRWLRGDVLVTWSLAPEGTAVTGESKWGGAGGSTADSGIPVESADTMKAGDIAAITDCATVDIFAVSDVSNPSSKTPKLLHQISTAKSVVNATAELYAAYNNEPTPTAPGKPYRASVHPLRYSVFYVCCTDSRSGALMTATAVDKCDSEPGRYRPALCAWDLHRRGTQRRISQVVVPDAADMRITFGTASDVSSPFSVDDTSPLPTATWVTTNARWPDVSAVHVEVLVAGATDHRKTVDGDRKPVDIGWPPNDAKATEPNTDTLGFSLAADSRLYQRFTIDLALRSRTSWYLPR